MSREAWQQVGRQRIHFDIRGALLQLQSAGDGVRHNSEANCRDRRGHCPVEWVATYEHLFILLLTDEKKGSAAEWVTPKVAAAPVWNHSECGVAHVPQQRGVGPFQVYNDRRRVWCLDRFPGRVRSRFHRRDRAAKDRVERPLHIARGKRAAVGEALVVQQPGAPGQVKDVG